MELCIRPVRVAQGQHKALRRISEAINPSDHVFERLDNQTSHETTKHKIPPGNGVYYSLDTLNRKRNSLNTSDPKEARRFEGPRAARNALACFY